MFRGARINCESAPLSPRRAKEDAEPQLGESSFQGASPGRKVKPLFLRDSRFGQSLDLGGKRTDTSYMYTCMYIYIYLSLSLSLSLPPSLSLSLSIFASPSQRMMQPS